MWLIWPTNRFENNTNTYDANIPHVTTFVYQLMGPNACIDFCEADNLLILP